MVEKEDLLAGDRFPASRYSRVGRTCAEFDTDAISFHRGGYTVFEMLQIVAHPVRIVEAAARQPLIHRVGPVQEVTNSELLDITGAGDAFGSAFRLHQGRRQQRHEDRDNHDHDQHFNERK